MTPEAWGLQRKVALGAWGLAALGALLSAIPISTATPPNPGVQLLDLVRIVATTALSFVLVMGPGILLRLRISRRVALGYVPVPGIALLVTTGIVAWGLGRLGWVHPRLVSALFLVPSMLAMLFALLRSEPQELLDRDECWAVGLMLLAIGVAIARSVWSLSPPGELYSGQIYRTLESDGIPDSRISYCTVQMIAHGINPFSTLGRSYFLPYQWSSRGPLASLAGAPIILLVGAHPPVQIGTPPWLPFDPQGFMAYRLVMIMLGGTMFLSMWSVTRRLAGARAARFVVVLAATTPFFIHELWFTWPKLFAVSMVLLGVLALLDRRPLLAGAFVGIGYLVHPIALLAAPFMFVLALWPLDDARPLRPRVLHGVLVLVVPVLAMEFWKWFNEPYYQDLSGAWKLANPLPPGMTTATLSWWLHHRAVELANAVVPLREFLLASNKAPLNSIYGPSPGILHLYFQYWFTLPFGVGITFFPLLLVSLWRSLRRWPWAVICLVLGQLLEIIIYWGNDNSVVIGTSSHLFIATLVILVAVQQHRAGFDWLRHRAIRGILSLRVAEIFLMAVLPTLVTVRRFYSPNFVLTDVAAFIALVVLSVALSVAVGDGVWRIRHADIMDADAANRSPRVLVPSA